MNKNFMAWISVVGIFSVVYFYRPSLFAPRMSTNKGLQTLPVAPTSTQPTSTVGQQPVPATQPAGAEVNFLAYPFLKTTGTMTSEEVSAMRSFLGDLGSNSYSTSSYNLAVLSVLKRIKDDAWYKTLANLMPVAPATTVTEDQIIAAGDALFPKPPFEKGFYGNQDGRVRPNAEVLARLKGFLDGIIVSSSGALTGTVNSGDHATILGLLFKHVSEYQAPATNVPVVYKPSRRR